MADRLPSIHELEALDPWVAERRRTLEALERHAARAQGKKIEPPKPLPLVTKPEPAGRTHLIIGDAHADPAHSNARFDWLGRALVDLQPDVVVDIGDFFSMDSLNAYDKPGSASFEGKRLALDLEAGIDAMERIRAQVDAYNRGTPRRKRYAPQWVRTLGNHEERIGRLLESDPKWQEFFGYHVLRSSEFGWEEHPFQEWIQIDGIWYTHYPLNARSAFAPKYVAARAFDAFPASQVFGHTHRLHVYRRLTESGMATVINCGCYFEHTEEWLPEHQQKPWTRGLLLLRDVRGGLFDFEWLGMDAIKRKYA